MPPKESMSTAKCYALPLENEYFISYDFLKRSDEVQKNRQRLEIFYQKNEIIELVKSNMVSVIRGETGSGKTTQIPQFLLEGGFAAKMVGMTQPRRITAISICERLNAEMGERLAGYKIMYENRMTSTTKIQVMTEGILLKEIEADFLLKKYAVIVLDEVHERSTNMDVLAGLLSKIIVLRHKREDPLRLIIMSATIDLSGFERLFKIMAIFDVEAKKNKVSVFYEAKTPLNCLEVIYSKILRILDAKDALDGAILVFLAGKEEIYALLEMLKSQFVPATILPLHSSMPKEEQEKVFMHYEFRKIILSTNIAESSITIDDISYVIDSGRVKVNFSDGIFTSYETQYICKSSAIQRMGRAGRTRAGVCFRIYSGTVYDSFDDHQTPQIKQKSFHHILFLLLSLGISNINKFPFITEPDPHQCQKAYRDLKRFRFIDRNNVFDLELARKCNKFPICCEMAQILVRLKESKNVFIYAFLAVFSMINVGFELKRNKDTEMFFIGSPSDFLVYWKIFRGFLSAGRKKEFSQKFHLPFSSLMEAVKLAEYICILTDCDRIADYALKDQRLDEVAFTKTVHLFYKKQIALRENDGFIFNGEVCLVSKESIDVLDSKLLAFEHVQKVGKKLFLKNITILDQ